MFREPYRTVPESELGPVFQQLLSATSRKDDRHTAVRWFNRLYYDVSRWNKNFIEFLKSYPGFDRSAAVEDYQKFLISLDKYKASLDVAYDDVKNELCSNLAILSQRFKRDFAWLYEEDPATFWSVRGLID